MDGAEWKKRLKNDTLAFFGVLCLLAVFIGLYYLKDETAYLNFLPENPLIFVVVSLICLEVFAFTALAYDQL